MSKKHPKIWLIAAVPVVIALAFCFCR